LTSRSGHAHPSQEKQLSTFQRGYDAGMKDAKLSLENNATIGDNQIPRLSMKRNLRGVFFHK